jgi:hypothetical protein
MPRESITCPNPECRASLTLAQPPAPGTKLRCPRCHKDFEAPGTAAAPPADGALALADEGEQRCPSCGAAMAPSAVLCIECGFNRRTGEKLKTKKEKARKPRGDGPVTQDSLPRLLSEANKLIRLARKEAWRLPRVLGLGDDADLFRIRAGGPDRCANPNCRVGLEAGSTLLGTPTRGGRFTAKVTVQVKGRSTIVYLCEDCTAIFLEEVKARKGTAKGYLDEARGDVERAAAVFPDDLGVREAQNEIRLVEREIEAAAASPRGRLCFIATAAYGTPFAHEVETLRCFRDEVLARSAPGRLLIRLYEAVSPPLAALLARSAHGRALVRALLRPVVRWLGGEAVR